MPPIRGQHKPLLQIDDLNADYFLFFLLLHDLQTTGDNTNIINGSIFR